MLTEFTILKIVAAAAGMWGVGFAAGKVTAWVRKIASIV